MDVRFHGESEGKWMTLSVVRSGKPTLVVQIHPALQLSFRVGMNDQVASTAHPLDASCVKVRAAFPDATAVRVHHVSTTPIARASHRPILRLLTLLVRRRIVGWHRSMLRRRMRLRMR